MKHYFYFWKLGWIAAVVTLLSLIVANLLARGAYHLLSMLDLVNSKPGTVAITAVLALVILLPAFGALFRVGMTAAGRWIRAA